MNDEMLSEISIPKDILQPLFVASNSFTLDEALECLIKIARATDGRSDLASKNVLTIVLKLCQSFSYPSRRHLVLLSLKLIRNLCAGEISNQNKFIEQNGVEIVSTIISSVRSASDSDQGNVQMGLQVLGNVSLAGEEHQRAIWHQFFPFEFLKIAKVRRKEICDPLCMVIFTCCEGKDGLIADLCSDQGLTIMTEIIRTASADGSGENWLQLLLSKICLEESHFASMFATLSPIVASGNGDDIKPRVDLFAPEQAFLLSILSEILNERLGDITVSKDFSLCVLNILKSSVGVLKSVSRAELGLPTGSTDIDVLGYSLTILRDICACDGPGGFKEEESIGVIDLLLNILSDLESPAIIKKTMKQSENEGTISPSSNLCPYKGFRRDVVAVIGNCAYRRKYVQDVVRQKNGILLMLQQCVNDEENLFLREWGIWSVRNLLEGNLENQRVVSELELQGSVDVPEITGLGLRVEVDKKSRRAKLVNVT